MVIGRNLFEVATYLFNFLLIFGIIRCDYRRSQITKSSSSSVVISIQIRIFALLMQTHSKMGKIKSFFSLLRGSVSPVYVALLFAAFVLWYITKLGGTYTTEHNVVVVIDEKEYDVHCTIRGKGTNLIGYTLSASRSRFSVTPAELSFDKEVTDSTGRTYRHITNTSLQQALASRMSDIDVVAVGAMPVIESVEPIL